MIPKSRFDEVNNRLKEALEKIRQFEEAEEKRRKEAEEQERKRKEEQGKFQELYETTTKELNTYKETAEKYENRVKELETVINSMLETKLKSIPKEFHDLIPENLTAEQKLEWISKAESKGIFTKKGVGEIGKPMNHSNDKPKVDKAHMSPLEKILAGLK
jgi:predicted RNase H-like nuclease (RuvC/YqgF family)